MENTDFIKTDENKIVNVKYIRWVQKVNECMELCSKLNGCSLNSLGKETITVCKMNSPDSFEKLDKYFK